MFDFVCIGDAAQDNFFFLGEEAANLECKLQPGNCQLVLNYGDKIPVEKIGVSLGGNAANVSVGLTQLGINTSLLTAFGDDERGAWIKRNLMQNGVDLSFSPTDKERESNLSGIIVYEGERTILTYHSKKSFSPDKIPPCKWVYVTTPPGRDSAPVYSKILSLADTKLALNPGVADLKRGSDFFSEIFPRTEVLFLNLSEANMLTGSEKDAETAIKTIAGLGARVTVVTEGGNGSWAARDGKIFHKPKVGVEVLEVTGAGDAYTSGFLAAYFSNQNMETCMAWGTKNAGSVVQKVGAIDGLMTIEQIRATSDNDNNETR